MVEVYHDCYSSAEAINYSVVVHMPNYADYKQADWVHNIGRKAVSINPLANSIEFYFYSVQKTEYISFNVTFKFAKHDPLVIVKKLQAVTIAFPLRFDSAVDDQQ